MKALSLVTLLVLSNISLLQAREIQPLDEKMETPITNPFLQGRNIASAPPVVDMTVQVHTRIAQLERELEIQKVNYEKKIEYLQAELRKSQKNLVERSVNQMKKEKMIAEDHIQDKKEMTQKLAITNQKLQEYQNLLSAVKPNQDMKLLIESNTQLAAELRKATNQLAHPNLKKAGATEAIAIKDTNSSGRFPASDSK